MAPSLRKWIFVLVYAASLGVYWITAPLLPESVPARFSSAGTAVGHMSRPVYLWLMAGLTALLPIVLLGALAWAPRRMVRFISIAHRDHWLAPARCAATVETLANAGYFMATCAAAFMGAMHWMITQASYATPPRLDTAPFFVLVGTFVGISIGFSLWLTWRFRRPA